MTPAEARSEISRLGAAAALHPERAADLAVEIQRLGRLIQSAPDDQLPTTAPSRKSICFWHNQVCKGHQICNAHPKGASE